MSDANEECPKCESIFIQWSGTQFECLERGCRHKWLKWPGGPRSYDEVENPHLKCSLPVGWFPGRSRTQREDLVEVRKVTKDIFELICLLADHKLRDFHLIADRTENMRKSYPFLKEEK